MTVTLDNKQISWIKKRIDEAQIKLAETINAGVHNIDDARSIVEQDDFLKKLSEDIGADKPMVKDLKTSPYKIPDEQLSTEDIGAPVIPEINSTKSIDDNTTVISSAQEQMTEAQEKAMEDIFDL